ncbi:MAG: DUF4886 domain-containing protein [Tannerella sp.]|jgi:hypothetical protein|nr:DUF4886 domain-containing protein [Tannerella sp.]
MKQIYTRLTVAVLFIFICCSIAAAERGDTIKILAIGNSFSEDAAEEYLDDLARAADIPVVIGNACIGGCSLERHYNNVIGQSANYSYRKINAKGEKTTTPDQTLLQCILDEDWDYITLQQASPLSGKADTYFPYLNRLVGFVRSRATNPQMKPAFHQTWAYAGDFKHENFAPYNYDQEQMYNAIVEAVNNAVSQTGITIVIPSGVAIQKARITMQKDNFCRDGYHLNKGIGRYTAACAWFETLSGKPVTENTFYPESITEEEAVIVREAAHSAVKEFN